MRQGQSFPWEKGSEYLLRVGAIREPYRFCVAALESMHSLVKFDEGMFLMLDGNRRVARKYFSNISKYWSSLYMEYYARLSPKDFDLNQEVSEGLDGSYVRVIRWEDYHSSDNDFISEYIRPRGLKESLAFTLFDLNGMPATAFSLDRVKGQGFSPRDIEVVKTVALHLNNLYKNLFVRPEGQVRIWERGIGADALTPREREVVDLICQGVTPANISRELHISIGTTNKHISHIYRKLEVENRQELLVRLLGK